jgi:hypothetical protein
VTDPNAALHAIQREAARRARDEFETAARATRHLFRHAKAAVRLLLGALAHGALAPEAYAAALERLVAGERAHSGAPVPLDVPAHVAQLAPLRAALNLPRGRALGAALGARGVLVVSDAGWRGWEELFEALFGSVNTAVVDWENAESVYDNPDGLGVVFHDVSPDSPHGAPADLVGRVKAAHFDLPVVVFTERDDVRAMARCLRAGAAGYFCYEPGTDRESVVTFEQFADLVREAIPPGEWRDLWGRLRAFAGPEPCSSGAALHRRAVAHLNRAYWFLTANVNDPRTKLLVDRSLFRQVVISCASALERVLAHEYQQLHRNATDAVRNNLDTGFAHMSKALAEKGVLSEELDRRFRTVWQRRNSAIHEDSHVTFAHAVRTLHDTIDALTDYFARHTAG